VAGVAQRGDERREHQRVADAVDADDRDALRTGAHRRPRRAARSSRAYQPSRNCARPNARSAAGAFGFVASASYQPSDQPGATSAARARLAA